MKKSEIETQPDFSFWIDKSKKGDSAVYYKGFLMMDRQTYILAGGTSSNAPEGLKIARSIWAAFMAGLVDLVQRKNGDFNYDYIAIKR